MLKVVVSRSTTNSNTNGNSTQHYEWRVTSPNSISGGSASSEATELVKVLILIMSTLEDICFARDAARQVISCWFGDGN